MNIYNFQLASLKAVTGVRIYCTGSQSIGGCTDRHYNWKLPGGEVEVELVFSLGHSVIAASQEESEYEVVMSDILHVSPAQDPRSKASRQQGQMPTRRGRV